MDLTVRSRADFERFCTRAVNYFMEDQRIVELLTEMLHEQKQTNDRLGSVESRLEQMDGRLGSMDQRLERVEKQQQTTNLKLQELSISNLKLADEIRIVVQYGERIVRLEAAVFH